MRGDFNNRRGQNHGDMANRRFNVPVCKQGNDAGMTGAFRVLVNQFVQGRDRRHRVQQQHQTGQQSGQCRFAEAIQSGLYVLQNVCNIAKAMPLASAMLIDGAAGRVARGTPGPQRRILALPETRNTGYAA
jgi:hypothetical protein